VPFFGLFGGRNPRSSVVYMDNSRSGYLTERLTFGAVDVWWTSTLRNVAYSAN